MKKLRIRMNNLEIEVEDDVINEDLVKNLANFANIFVENLNRGNLALTAPPGLPPSALIRLIRGESND